MKLGWLTVLVVTAIAGNAYAQKLITVPINGLTTDFTNAGVQYRFEDVQESAITNSEDIQLTWIANDATYVYFGIQTYGAQTATSEFRIYFDLRHNTPSGGAFQADDQYVDLLMNGTACQTGRRITPFTVDNGATDATQVTETCTGNIAGSGSFIDGRVRIADLYNGSGVTAPTNGKLDIGVFVENVTSGDVSPGVPIPTFIEYNNTSTVTPTFARVRTMTAAADKTGVSVRWHTSSEYFSAGTWVARQVGDSWQPVHTAPLATQNSEIGGDYAVLDPNGHAGDVYALFEVDSRTAVHVFGPISATEEALTQGAQLTRTTMLVDPVVTRATAMQTRLDVRSASVATRVASLIEARLGSEAAGHVGAVDVDVTREGLYAVCDSDTARFGGVPASVSLRGSQVRAFSITAPCAGLGFYAAAPSSPYAAFDVYRVVLGPARALSSLGDAGSAAQSATTDATLTTVITPRRYLDMRDGAPNRFFWSFASRDPSAPVALPSFTGTADFTVSVHPLAATAQHELVVRTDHEVARTAVTDGWSTVTLPGLPLGGAPSISFSTADADPTVIETMLIADATVRYKGQPAMVSGSARFDTATAGWVGVKDGSGRAFDVSTPSNAYVLNSAPLAGGAGLAVYVDATPHTVFVGAFTRATVAPAASDPTIDDVSTEADYLVLAPHALVSTAQELVTLHEADGLKGVVISYDALYSHFSNSNPDPAAVPALLDWAALRWRTAPRYLVIVGSVTSDPYGYTGSLRANDAPLVSSLDPTFNYRRFSDRELVGPRPVAVGRIPTSDPAELGRYIDKLRLRHAATPIGQWTMVPGALTGDGLDFDAMIDEVAANVVEHTVSTLSSVTTDHLVAAWSESDVITYIGHGDSESWADDLLAPDTTPSLVSARPPVTMSAACLDGLTTSGTGGLAWSLVTADATHGSIAAIAPSSIVDPNDASLFIAQVASLIDSGAAQTWGDAWLRAQATQTTSAARTMVLLGDPAVVP